VIIILFLSARHRINGHLVDEAEADDLQQIYDDLLRIRNIFGVVDDALLLLLAELDPRNGLVESEFNVSAWVQHGRPQVGSKVLSAQTVLEANEGDIVPICEEVAREFMQGTLNLQPVPGVEYIDFENAPETEGDSEIEDKR
jgi:hypothetical protein